MAPLCIYSTLVLLIWTCHTHQQEEEIFNSDKQSTLGWSSEPQRQWSDVQLGLGTNSPVPVLQACGKRIYRTVLSKWMERKDAHYLLMDVTFAQEQEPDGQPRLLQVHLFDSDTPITTFRNRQAVVDLETTEPFPSTATRQQISQYMRNRTALSLGSVWHRGFQLAFSYSGTCVLVTSIRLYYRKCPDIMHELVSFHSTGAGSGRLTGTCVKGAVEFSTPVRECNTDGVWGPLEGGCSCRPGHQVVDGTCQACHMGFYKPANANEGCRPCPANTRTHNEGSERCSCVQGFSRFPNDTDGLGCTKPPSAPVNLTAQHHNDSVLLLTWDPPQDWGGRQEMTYRIKCEEEAEASGQWGPCKNDTGVILPEMTGLSGTSVSIIGLNPQSSYKLSVQAWNDISSLQGAPPSSTTTVIIHRWKAPPVVITVTPGLNATHQERTAAPQHQGSSSAWPTLAVSLGLLVLVCVVLLALWVICRDSAKFRSHRQPDLLPLAVAFSYRRPQEVEMTPQQLNSDNGVEGVAQLLEGISDRMLASLREVLVERAKLTLGKELGRGEFGSVYEGVFNPDEGMEIKVAVKTMRVGILSHDDLHEFLREAEIMQNFDHENVIKLLGVTLQREQDCPLPVPLVILPYMKHGDLRRFLIDTRYGDTPMFVPHQSLLRFMIDIATGMDYLSSQGFLHRDLAARNCMLSDDLRVCVADFGLSKKIYSSNYYRQNVAIRVPIKWMAMESLSLSVYTTKSDVWSFGVTMWEIVSRGRTPYPGIQNSELLDLLSSGHRLKTPTDCDDKLYKVMQSCWEEEPAHRPSFRELTQMLKGLLSELPVLEASEEVSYINQVLEVSAAAGVHQNPYTHYGARLENVYLSNPVTAAAEVDVEDGYLKCFTNSAVNIEEH